MNVYCVGSHEVQLSWVPNWDELVHLIIPFVIYIIRDIFFSHPNKYSFIHYVHDLSEFEGYNFLAAMVAMHQEDIDEGPDLQVIGSAPIAESCIMNCVCMHILPVKTLLKVHDAFAHSTYWVRLKLSGHLLWKTNFQEVQAHGHKSHANKYSFHSILASSIFNC